MCEGNVNKCRGICKREKMIRRQARRPGAYFKDGRPLREGPAKRGCCGPGSAGAGVECG